MPVLPCLNMSCYGCKCNFCARNCELYPRYFTLGEIEDVSEACYTCDECRHFDSDPCKRSMWRRECDGHREPIKYIEARATAMRQRLRVIQGGKP